MPEPELDSLQEWMSLVIRHERDAAVAVRSKKARALIASGEVQRGLVVKPSATMQPLERLDVYNGGYLTRLVEALEIDYPGLAHALRTHWFEHGWDRLVGRYVLRHPSRHPNLNQLGLELPAFVARQRDLPHRAFLHDIARLERAISESFDAPEFTPLDTKALQEVPAERWPGAVLRTNPSLALLRLQHPASAWLLEVAQGNAPAIPARRATFLAVYRTEHRVVRLGMPRAMFGVLAALQQGARFEDALAGAGEHGEDVAHWFREWSAAGLFTAVALGG